MYANDRYGDCVWAMFGHVLQAVTTYGQGRTTTVDVSALLKGYTEVTGFHPDDPATDQGTVIQDGLDYWRKTGIAGHKIVAFAEVDHTDLDMIHTAIYLFGAVLVGINFPAAAMDQFNRHQPWDVVADDGGIQGGHAIPVGYYDTTTERVVTWGRVQRMTPEFWGKYVEEAWVVITPEWVNTTGESPGGIDLHGLGEDFAALTGQPNPFPQPSPPDAADVDKVFSVALRGWLGTHHTGAAGRVADAAQAWLAAKGL